MPITKQVLMAMSQTPCLSSLCPTTRQIMLQRTSNDATDTVECVCWCYYTVTILEVVISMADTGFSIVVVAHTSYGLRLQNNTSCPSRCRRSGHGKSLW
jgi:hypothetical protein